MEKNNTIKKLNDNIFFNLLKKEESEESFFIGSIDDLQKGLSSFWEKMQN